MAIQDKERLDDDSLDLILRNARTHNVWLPTPVPESTLLEIWNLMKFGPTSANCSPLRIVFVRSPQAKERLVACMSESNQAKTRVAPVTAILAMDLEFYDKLPRLFPHDRLPSGLRASPLTSRRLRFVTAAAWLVFIVAALPGS